MRRRRVPRASNRGEERIKLEVFGLPAAWGRGSRKRQHAKRGKTCPRRAMGARPASGGPATVGDAGATLSITPPARRGQVVSS